MDDKVERFKKNHEQEVFRNIDKYFPNLTKEQIASLKQDDLKFTYGSEDKIRSVSEDNSVLEGTICCVVAVTVLGTRVCTIPPLGDPNNMC